MPKRLHRVALLLLPAASAMCTGFADDPTDAGGLPDGSIDPRSTFDAVDAGPVVFVGSPVVDPTTSLLPAVTMGETPDGDAGSWMIRLGQEYPPAPQQNDEPHLVYSAGPNLASIGPTYSFTPHATRAAITPLTAAGGAVVVYECSGPPDFPANLCNFTGQYTFAGGGQSAMWPFEGLYSSGYRPRVAGVVTTTPDGFPMANLIEVHMLSPTLGALSFHAAYSVANGGGVPGSIQGVGWGGPTVYDHTGQNPDIAVTSALSGGVARGLEVHEGSPNGLYYREVSFIVYLDTSPTLPTVIWSAVYPYPGAEQGANPAIAIYGTTIVEFHESFAGGILVKVGQFQPGSGVTWGPSLPYAEEGLNPAVAIDPATGNGVELHESRVHPGQILGRAFVVRP